MSTVTITSMETVIDISMGTTIVEKETKFNGHSNINSNGDSDVRSDNNSRCLITGKSG